MMVIDHRSGIPCRTARGIRLLARTVFIARQHKKSYGVDVCPVNKSQTASLQYVVDNCFRKIFDIKSTEIVRHCMSEFCALVTALPCYGALGIVVFEFKWLMMCDMIDTEKRKFLEKFSISKNSLCQVIVHMCNPR